MTLRTLLLLTVLLLLAVALLWWPLVFLSVRPLAPDSLLHCDTPVLQDGDSLLTHCGGEAQRIRLHCIDAPEMGQRPWSEASRNHLQSLVGQPLRVRVVTQDNYGRLVGEVWRAEAEAAQPSVNQQMVRAGQAVVFRRYCNEAHYYALERQAREARLGVWSQNGEQQRPWRYRQRKRAENNKPH